MSLFMLDTKTSEKQHILNYCSYVQWVPGSDVVVAQSRNSACVWYNIDTADRVTSFSIRGDIVDVVRQDSKTEIISQEGSHRLGYELDEGLVEFGTAVHDSDFGRAVLFLESLESKGNPDTEAMWQNLADIVLQLQNLTVARRCFAALGDMPKTHFLDETLKIAEDYAQTNGGDGMNCPEVWARMAILNKQLKTAESIYLEQNQLEKALGMYKELYKWDEALELAEATGYSKKESLKKEYLSWLIRTGQFERAGQMKEKDGEYHAALNMYLEEGLASTAARLVMSKPELVEEEGVVRRVVSRLEEEDQWQQLGQLQEALGLPDRAVRAYSRAGAYALALNLARQSSPQDVLRLEEEWGDYLTSTNQLDAAINHYIEANKTVKALEASVGARQWKKAVQIINVINEVETLLPYYTKLGQHFASVKEFNTAEKLFVKAGLFKDAMQMYLDNGEWEKAYSVGTSHMDPEEVTEIMTKEGKSQEALGNYKAAESLYISSGSPDTAIAMYKNLNQYDQMMELVEKHHPDLVSTTHLHLAQSLEAEGNWALAEHHYTSAGEWKLAVKMLRTHAKWENAYKVALEGGGEQAAQQVAFLWAKSMGTESAVRLLTKLGLLEQAIDYACDSYQFDFGFELAKAGLKRKLGDVHYKYAMTLEDDGNFGEAEKHFILAERPKEAILMYIHGKEWDNAERVAESSEDKDSVVQVLTARAKHEFNMKNFAKFETLLLRARKPEVIVQQYQENGMWVEALRVCKDYLPTKLGALEAEYEREVGSRGARDASALMLEASQWESHGRYLTAVQCLLKVNQNNTSDREQLVKALNEAARITSQHLDSDEAAQIIKILVNRLVDAKEHSSAAQLLLRLDMVKEAVEILTEVGDWESVAKITNQVDSRVEATGWSGGSDAVDRLDALCQQGHHLRAIDLARGYGPALLHKYIALYAAHLIKNNESAKAVELYREHGAPGLKQNFNIYRRLAEDMFGTQEEDASYASWASLRDMFHQICEELWRSGEQVEEFEMIREAAHYLALRSACAPVPSLQAIATKQAIALLRYSQVIPADKAYYMAGMAAKEVEHYNEGFVFLNHCLDLVEAIEEGSCNVDYTDLVNTDFPRDVPLPNVSSLTEQQIEDVRQWVLSVSMDQNLDMVLPVDGRGVYPCSLSGTEKYQPCIITGWPVIPAPPSKRSQSHITFSPSGRQANSHDWSSINMALRMDPGNSPLSDVLTFLTKWVGSAPNYSFM